MTTEEYEASLHYIRHMSKEEGIDKALSKYDIDVIIGPGDSFMSTLASAAGKVLLITIERILILS